MGRPAPAGHPWSMKNVLMLVLAVLGALLVLKIALALVGALLGLALFLGVVALIGIGAVTVFRSLTRRNDDHDHYEYY